MSGDGVIALVPMRHSSERVAGKNYRLLGGVPLFHHIVRALQDSGVVDGIVIDTDSPNIADDAAGSFPDVVVLERPAHLRSGDTPMNDVLLHTTSVVEADLYLQTHSTNPLLRPETIRDAVTTHLSSRPAYDSMFSVTRLQTRLWWDAQRPINHDPAVLLRTQDLPPVYEENSNLFLFTREVLLKNGNRIGARPQLYEIDRAEAWDIDEEVDWQVVEALYERRSR